MLILYNLIIYFKKYNIINEKLYTFFLNVTKISGKKPKHHIITIIIIDNDE